MYAGSLMRRHVHLKGTESSLTVLITALANIGLDLPCQASMSKVCSQIMLLSSAATQSA